MTSTPHTPTAAATAASPGPSTGATGATTTAATTGSTGGTRFGYARVSTADQSLDAQLATLREVGCARLWSEHASGADRERPELAAMLEYLRPGDALVVTKLDRLARSVAHLVELVSVLQERGIDLIVISQNIDTTTPAGRLLFHVIAAVGEFERDLIRERTKEGLKSAADQGRKGGRPVVCGAEKTEAAQRLIASGMSVSAAANQLGVSRRTLHRHLSEAGSR